MHTKMRIEEKNSPTVSMTTPQTKRNNARAICLQKICHWLNGALHAGKKNAQ
jgi:hypothetical protein